MSTPPLVRKGKMNPAHWNDATGPGSVLAPDNYWPGSPQYSKPVAVIDLSRREELRDKVAAVVTWAQRGDSAHEIADAVLAALLGEGK